MQTEDLEPKNPSNVSEAIRHHWMGRADFLNAWEMIVLAFVCWLVGAQFTWWLAALWLFFSGCCHHRWRDKHITWERQDEPCRTSDWI